MNVVGPLANPARAGRQVLGVADPARLPLMAGALAALGTDHAMVVHGEAGLDEIAPMGRTRVLEVKDGEVKTWQIDPASFGIPEARPEDLAGGAPARNAEIIQQVLSGKGKAGATSAVVLNAAAALYVAGGVKSFADAVAQARDGIASAAGLGALSRMRAAYTD
jgi:anthranilate phosphoribosyltransferase